MENAVKQINRIIDNGTPDELMTWLQKPEGLLPVVDASRPNLYMDNLKKTKADKGSVSYLESNDYKIKKKTFKFLTSEY